MGGRDDCMSRRLVDMGVALFLVKKKKCTYDDVCVSGRRRKTQKFNNSMVPN